MEFDEVLLCMVVCLTSQAPICITNAKREHGALFSVMRATNRLNGDPTPVWVRQTNKLNHDVSTAKRGTQMQFSSLCR